MLRFVKLFVNCDFQFLPSRLPFVKYQQRIISSLISWISWKGTGKGSVPIVWKRRPFQNLLKQRRVPGFREIQTVYCQENSGFFATSLPNPLPSIKVGRSRITYTLNLNISAPDRGEISRYGYMKVLEYVRKMYCENVKRREISLRARRRFHEGDFCSFNIQRLANVYQPRVLHISCDM